jgi:hypothetical protein
MPVVLRVDGFSFNFYSNDHSPPHVHVTRAGTACRVLLDSLVVTDTTMKPADEAKALLLVTRHRGELALAWTNFQLRKRGA